MQASLKFIYTLPLFVSVIKPVAGHRWGTKAGVASLDGSHYRKEVHAACKISVFNILLERDVDGPYTVICALLHHNGSRF